MLAKAVIQKRFEIDFFLANEAGAWQLSMAMGVDHRTDAGGRRDLDSTPNFIADFLTVDLARVADLNELPFALTRDRAERDNDVLEGYGDRVFEDVFENVPPFGKVQIVHKE